MEFLKKITFTSNSLKNQKSKLFKIKISKVFNFFKS